MGKHTKTKCEIKRKHVKKTPAITDFLTWFNSADETYLAGDTQHAVGDVR